MTAASAGVAILTLTLLWACGPGTKQRHFRALPGRTTVATLAGPLCDGAVCKCREPGDDPGSPDPGHKRYEIEVGPIDNELWVLLDEMVLYKTVERSTACFYVDLTPGKHAITVRGKGKNGFAARLRVAELGAKGAYDTFDFQCGGPDHCQLSTLESWHAGLAKYKRNVHDPCGSTKVRDIDWQSGKSPDLIHPTELELYLVLDVYDFVPEHGPGDPACADKY